MGGLITGISPCVLPVLPAIFVASGIHDGGERTGRARKSDRSRPYLVVGGLALSFSLVTLLGTLVLRALPLSDNVIRWSGLVVLVLLGIGMLVPRIEELLEKPFSRIPTRHVTRGRGGFVLGLALGTVYVPCAGPVLAAITVAGATGKISYKTVVLTVAFALGTAVPLLFFALAGRRVAERVQAFRRHQRGVRTVAGVVVIGLAVALTFNVTDVLQRAVPDYTASVNKAIVHGGGLAKILDSKQNSSLADCAQGQGSALQNCGPAPGFAGISTWLNTPGHAPLNLAALKGKVVLVDFWAYSCINCQRAIAHVDAWYARYRNAGFVVVGVHTPEYTFEHVPANVAAGAKRLGIQYPIAIDNAYDTWNNYGNQSWPADYLIDSTGAIRYASVGEGDYALAEGFIRRLLGAANPGVSLPAPTHVADMTPTVPQTPESYLGLARANNYLGSPQLTSGTHVFSYPPMLPSDEFALTGTWTVTDESLTAGTGAGIRLNFHAGYVYLDVSGSGTITATSGGRTKTYPVTGAPDIYTVAHQSPTDPGSVDLRLSPGLKAYSFTFG